VRGPTFTGAALGVNTAPVSIDFKWTTRFLHPATGFIPQRLEKDGHMEYPGTMIDVRPVADVGLVRLYVLRAMYAVIAFAQGLKTWPAILHPAHAWDFWNGVGLSFFGALTALSLLGIRYPVRMLPLLLFEFAWKLIWALAVWLPALLNHSLTGSVADNAAGIVLGAVVVPILLPWGYLWKQYVVAPGDRWH